MRKLILILCGLFLFMGTNFAFAQVRSRPSLFIAPQKTSTTTADIPCAGTVVLSEDFESGIPGTWTVIDGDGLMPDSAMQLIPGWQSRVDYRDGTNHLVVTPSWYDPIGTSDDWLITPAIALGNNPCLSWRAYSQDQNFKEAYEVRVATTPDTAALLANAVITSISEEDEDPHTLAASLSAWAGQTVYIAFRQTSVDKFVLALDDVKVTNVNTIDIGVYGLSYGSPDPGDTVTIRFQVANYGSDTVTSFQALYTIDGGSSNFMNVGPVSIPPNGTLFFDHSSLYLSDSVDANYDLCAWTTLPNATFDQEILNDTLCTTLTVGEPVVRPEPAGNLLEIALYPNPCADHVKILAKGAIHGKARIRILDLGGRELSVLQTNLIPNQATILPVEGLSSGMYFVAVEMAGHKTYVEKLIKR